jgi:hypothetical protein
MDGRVAEEMRYASWHPVCFYRHKERSYLRKMRALLFYYIECADQGDTAHRN